MPQSYLSPPPQKRSEPAGPRTHASPDPGGDRSVFTREGPPEPPKSSLPPEPRPAGNSTAEGLAPDLSLETTEPFPEGLFRIPVPDRVFSGLPNLSDSALRALLALIRLSFRFDPEDSTWTCPARSFSRADVQAECGLSGQGTRDGLTQLEEEGYLSVDRGGRAHEHELELGVPDARFTYLPVTLLEEADRLSGSKLRALLVVFRETWGWTGLSDGAGENGSEGAPEHRRWTRLSAASLARRAGRSQTAIVSAARQMNGGLLERLRPTGGAYYYRIRPDGLTDLFQDEEPDERSSTPTVRRRAEASFSMGIPNELAPDRQRTGPSNAKESRLKKKTLHAQDQATKRPDPGERTVSDGEDAMPETQSRNRQERSTGKTNSNEETQPSQDRESSTEEAESSLIGFSDRKRKLGQALVDAGVWRGPTLELLRRYSAERIAANLKRARRKRLQIADLGAWLYTAISEGYALPSPGSKASDRNSGDYTEESPDESHSSGSEQKSRKSLPPLSHKQKVSTTQLKAYVRQGIASADDFHRFADPGEPEVEQHIYFDPAIGGPTPKR